MTALDETPILIDDAFVVADTKNIPRGEWLELRSRGIGGSDAAAIAGLNPRKSAFEVFLEKSAAPGLDDDTDSEAALWGRVLEPVVRDQVAAREDVIIQTFPSLLASRHRPWQLANVDGFVHDPRRPDGHQRGVYEGKTTSVWLRDEWDDNQVPDAAALQGMHYLAVTGLPWVLYGALIGGQRLVVRRIERDQELIDHLISIEADFWQGVREGRPPAPDGSKNCTDLIAHLWDVKPDAVITLDPAEVEPILDAYRTAHAAEKAAADAKAAAGNQLKLLLGEHEVALDPDGRKLFTWKATASRRLDQAALAEAHPDLVEAFKSESIDRRLYVPKPKAA